ncbi:carbamoyltransferase [Gammaproteobacteria bacterium]|nr:carbamoyltransferase [Gammaproteobacteria bacterium]
MTTILGISAYYHDSAAALLRDGQIVAAAHEERFSRIKGDSSFPAGAINYCLEEGELTEEQIDHVVFYEHPVAHFERLLRIYHLSAPKSLKSYLRAMPSWLTNKLWLQRVIAEELGITKPVHLCDHHLSHAAAAFFPSPFEEAAILTIDGVGEWSTASFGVGKGREVDLFKDIRFPNSVGLLYSAFTFFTGFKINSGEYKLMGLAPYGSPIYADLILEKLINLDDDGAIQLNQHYFDYVGGLTMTNDAFAELFHGPRREPETEITQREMDIAASVQDVLNRVVLKMARYVRKTTGAKNLVLAGGVALNVVSMGLLVREKIFDRVWIQPAAGDAGSSLGAAYWFWHQKLCNSRTVSRLDRMKGAFLGPTIKGCSADDDEALKRLGAVWTKLPEERLQNRVAELIAEGRVVAVARGRSEWGPRALGARSILGDARSPWMQSHMNLKIKFRESFRPFAPMVLAEDAAEYFDIDEESPYMLFAHPVCEKRRIQIDGKLKNVSGIELLKVNRSEIPAVTHVDYSARVQTIDSERNPFMHRVISAFKELTGCSVIINTSFNVRGEPIVNSAEDAFRCFVATNIDWLVIGDRLLDRLEQRCDLVPSEDCDDRLRGFLLD